MKHYKITHDRDQCIGCGACALEAPQTWELDKKDGLANLKNSKNENNIHSRTIDEVDYEANKRACDACPMGLISISEEE